MLRVVFAGQPRQRDLQHHDDTEVVARGLSLSVALRLLSRDEFELDGEHRYGIAEAIKVPFDKGAR